MLTGALFISVGSIVGSAYLTGLPSAGWVSVLIAVVASVLVGGIVIGLAWLLINF